MQTVLIQDFKQVSRQYQSYRDGKQDGRMLKLKDSTTISVQMLQEKLQGAYFSALPGAIWKHFPDLKL